MWPEKARNTFSGRLSLPFCSGRPRRRENISFIILGSVQNASTHPMFSYLPAGKHPGTGLSIFLLSIGNFILSVR